MNIHFYQLFCWNIHFSSDFPVNTSGFQLGQHNEVVIPSAGKKRKASAVEENPDEVGDDVEKDKARKMPGRPAANPGYPNA